MDINEFEAKLKKIDGLDESSFLKTNVGDIDASGKVLINITSDGVVSRRSNIDGDLKSSEKSIELNLSDTDVPDDYIEDKIKTANDKQDLNGELPLLILSQLGAGKLYRIEADYRYDTKFGASTSHTLIASKGTVYDRASIPRIFWVIIDKDSLSNIPPLFHDLLYRYEGDLPDNQITPYRKVTRPEADNLFLELMLKTGVKHWRAKLAYEAVSKFSGFAWRRRV